MRQKGAANIYLLHLLLEFGDQFFHHRPSRYGIVTFLHENQGNYMISCVSMKGSFASRDLCQELISKYLDEDEPMREWLSRMNTGKVLFHKRANLMVFFWFLYVFVIILLMEEIPNNHLGCIKPCK